MGEDDLIIVITSYGASPRFSDDGLYHQEEYNAILVPKIDVYKLASDDNKIINLNEN